MAAKQPRFTENFSANLTAIETFLGPRGQPAYRRFLDHLFDDAIPSLCRFPQSGRSFLVHTIKSAKAKALTKKLRKLLDKEDDLRECVTNEYLLLYLVRRGQVIFLAVKHYRQLSFDLKQFWSEEMTQGSYAHLSRPAQTRQRG
jgi:plasmid stabilization system protein ParE